MSPINPGQAPLLAYHLAVAERCPVKMSGGGEHVEDSIHYRHLGPKELLQI